MCRNPERGQRQRVQQTAFHFVFWYFFRHKILHVKPISTPGCFLSDWTTWISLYPEFTMDQDCHISTFAFFQVTYKLWEQNVHLLPNKFQPLTDAMVHSLMTHVSSWGVFHFLLVIAEKVNKLSKKGKSKHTTLSSPIWNGTWCGSTI